MWSPIVRSGFFADNRWRMTVTPARPPFRLLTFTPRRRPGSNQLGETRPQHIDVLDKLVDSVLRAFDLGLREKGGA
jgi:hypothetical protein